MFVVLKVYVHDETVKIAWMNIPFRLHYVAHAWLFFEIMVFSFTFSLQIFIDISSDCITMMTCSF